MLLRGGVQDLTQCHEFQYIYRRAKNSRDYKICRLAPTRDMLIPNKQDRKKIRNNLCMCAFAV